MIRLMDLSDLDKIVEIEKTLFSDAWSYDNYLYELQENEFSKSYVMCDGECIIGYAVLYILFERAEIATIAIKKDFQSKGHGQMFMNYLIEEALKEDCDEIALEVRVSNKKAISLYEKNGFEHIRVRKSYYSDNYEDAYEMSKALGGLYEKDICD